MTWRTAFEVSEFPSIVVFTDEGAKVTITPERVGNEYRFPSDVCGGVNIGTSYEEALRRTYISVEMLIHIADHDEVERAARTVGMHDDWDELSDMDDGEEKKFLVAMSRISRVRELIRGTFVETQMKHAGVL